eukprot:scaffold3340_cov114-Isochrysis_galbana.AAC.11
MAAAAGRASARELARHALGGCGVGECTREERRDIAAHARAQPVRQPTPRKLAAVRARPRCVPHQRSPTINLPETFFTVQKSNASIRTQTTKMFTKFDEKRPPKR